MKTSVLIIYVPVQRTQEDKDWLDKNLRKLKDTRAHENYEIFYIEDPTRGKVETEVHFNPYQE